MSSLRYLTSSTSGNVQVLSKNAFSGPYRRKTISKSWPFVGTQFDSLPAVAVGPKNTSSEPSAFCCTPALFDARLECDVSRISACVLRSYAVAD